MIEKALFGKFEGKDVYRYEICDGDMRVNLIEYGAAIQSLYFKGVDCVALCAMDARCSQVYMAMFDCENDVVRLCEDKAVMIAEIPEMIKNFKKDVIILGDGAELCYNYLKTVCDNVRLAPVLSRYQRASGVAVAAECGAGERVSADELNPVYLRVPQAERELKKRSAE